MSTPLFVVEVRVHRMVWVNGKRIPREEFLLSLPSLFSSLDYQGLHEGTVLSEEAHALGYETESWTVDGGLAPQERDWVEEKEFIDAQVYLGSQANADRAVEVLREETDVEVLKVFEQEARDWNEEWKRSFRGVELPPYWRILPPHVDEPKDHPERRTLWINPGAGFGTGTHETTQLILTVMGEEAKKWWGARVLDFGSGSGILSIGAALLGAQVDGVEIDPLAIENAFENSKLNQVEPLIRYSTDLKSVNGPYDFVIANIIRGVLEEFASELLNRLKPGGTLILSGVTENDLPSLLKRYREEFTHDVNPEIRKNGDWRAVIFRSGSWRSG